MVVGPTALLGPAIRGAAAQAARQLLETLTRFSDHERRCTSDELREAVGTAAAWSESLMAYDYVENHAMTPGD